MTSFPVSSSILSAFHLSDFIRETYALSNATTCSLIKTGINHTYRVVDNTASYVFRIYSFNWRILEEISEELRLLNQLSQQGISISFPIADKQGNYIQTISAPEGDRFAVLFSFADGHKLHAVSAETHFEIGVLVAQIHQVTAHLTLNRITYTPQVLLADSLRQLARFLGNDTEEMAFMRSLQSYLFDEFAHADTQALRTGVVHLDIWFDNLNVTDNNEITLFDFDFCGNGWLALDMAYYIMQLHNVEKYEPKDYQPKVDSFLNGYQSITSISDEERRLIPSLGLSLYFFYLGIQCQRYDNWSNSFLNENYLKRFINGLVKTYLTLTQPKASRRIKALSATASR